MKRYLEDMSEQEIELLKAIGRELPPHRPEGITSEQLPVVHYNSREEVPEQARELWDLVHKEI